MKAILNATPNMSVEVEGEGSAALFEEIAIASEVFIHEKCGCCNSTNFKFVCREIDDGKFYELHCLGFIEATKKPCKAKLIFGVKKGKISQLYPKRHWNSLSPGDKQNRNLEEQPTNLWLPHNGWFRWQPSATAKKDEN